MAEREKQEARRKREEIERAQMLKEKEEQARVDAEKALKLALQENAKRQKEEARRKKEEAKHKELKTYITKQEFIDKQGTEAFDAAFAEYNDQDPDNALNTSQLACNLNGDRPSLMRYQAMAVQLSKVVERFMCVWRTGAGKTLAMIKILDTFFDDPRPKVLIFPTQPVCDNFFGELMKFPNKYRAYVESRFKGKSATLQQVKDTLAMKGTRASVHRGLKASTKSLRAPLRTLTYRIAGGSALTNNPIFNFRPRLKVLNKAKDGLETKDMHKEKNNKYSGCIVLMDEFHNLLGGLYYDKRAKKTDRDQLLKQYLLPEHVQYADRLKRLADHLSSAQHSVVVGMTATPIKNDPEDGRRLMAILKGGDESKTNHGFVTYFNELTPKLYPDPSSGKNLDVAMFPDNIVRIKKIQLSKEHADHYLRKVKEYKGDEAAEKLFNYVNVQMYKNFCKNQLSPKIKEACKKEIPKVRAERARPKAGGRRKKTPAAPTTVGGGSDEERAEALKRVLKRMAPKLYQIIVDADANEGNTLVLAHRNNGFRCMMPVLRHLCELKQIRLEGCPAENGSDPVLYKEGVDGTPIVVAQSQVQEKQARKGSTVTVQFSEGGKRYTGVVRSVNHAKQTYSVLFKQGAVDIIDRFAHNSIRILFADTRDYAEGVSFLGVTNLILVNPAKTLGEHKQQIGRILRLCDGPGRAVTITMYAGTMEHSPVKTVDEVYLERLRKEFTTLNDALVQQFKVPAVDAREEYNRELGGSNGEGYMGKIWSYAKKVKDALLPDELKKRFNLRAGSNHFNRK